LISAKGITRVGRSHDTAPTSFAPTGASKKKQSGQTE
jgi:hypothetical protein